MAELGDLPEIVLLRRPRVIYVEVPTANDKLRVQNGKNIYCLNLCVKTWSLDRDHQVTVRRYGFPIVPDFGGTAHAYCGDTLQAVIGDLMKWDHIPSLENALRAYIIKSRIRNIEHLLLAQPYSPMLFRQGVQPGPHLLLQVLRGEITTKEAKRQWDVFNKNSAKKATSDS